MSYIEETLNDKTLAKLLSGLSRLCLILKIHYRVLLNGLSKLCLKHLAKHLKQTYLQHTIRMITFWQNLYCLINLKANSKYDLINTMLGKYTYTFCSCKARKNLSCILFDEFYIYISIGFQWVYGYINFYFHAKTKVGVTF